MISQPIDAQFQGAKRVLIAGCGGGYDVLGGVPLGVALARRGCEIHYASLAFTYLNGLDGTLQSRTSPNLYRVPPGIARRDSYCPEAWMADALGTSVWAFDKTGVVPLRRAYEELCGILGIDTVVLVDGGIDALLRGDETSLGTPAEDLASMAAVHALPIARKLLACIGLGAELRDGIPHEQVFARIAEINRHGGLLGASLLLPQTEEGVRYMQVHAAMLAGQKEVRQSHVHRLISTAMRGKYGLDGPHISYGPWLHQYWYFDLATVAKTHLFLEHLVDTESIGELNLRIDGIRNGMDVRDRTALAI